MIATGLHRPATEDEVIELVGKEIKSKIRVISHDARSNDKNTFIGKSSGGIEVYINEVPSTRKRIYNDMENQLLTFKVNS